MEEELREWVNRNLAGFRVPGAVVAMVKDGEASIEPFGVRAAGGADAVTEATAFSIASCSKAFTATAAAMLVESGSIGFDEPVQSILPELELDDPWITAHVTLRDLLAMRLGLLGVGVLAFGADLPHAQVFARLKHLTRIAGFRCAWTYLNPAYRAIAEIISRRSGQPFGSVLRERIFAPLAMTDALVDVGSPLEGRDIAVPHSGINDEIAPLSEQRCWGGDGATGVYLNGRDAIRWLSYNLSGDTASGKRLLAESSRQQIYADHIPAPPIAALGHNVFAYCLGWQACDFRGRRVFMHEGGELGVRAHTILCPSERFGVSVFANLASPEAVKSTTYHLLDNACAGSGTDWAERFREVEQQTISLNIAALANACPIEAGKKAPRICTGVFHEPANGRVRIIEGTSGLEMHFDDATLYASALEPLGGDVFGLRCFNPAADESMRGHLRLRLVADATGKVMTVVVPSLNATFTRVD